MGLTVYRLCFLILAALPMLSFSGERIVFADKKLSIELPEGWKDSKRKPAKSLGGWETPDETTSAFFSTFRGGNNNGMEEIMDYIVESYDASEALDFEKVAEYKTGQVNGVDGKKFPAIYTTLDVTFHAQKAFEMKYYLFVVDTGAVQYFIQASTTRPVRKAREKQIFDMFKSLIAKK